MRSFEVWRMVKSGMVVGISSLKTEFIVTRMVLIVGGCAKKYEPYFWKLDLMVDSE